MNKYHYIQIVELILSSNETVLNQQPQENKSVELDKYLTEGYEIYHAIPLSIRGVAVIKYILRKEIEE